MIASIQQFITCLHDTYTRQDKEGRDEATRKLAVLESNPMFAAQLIGLLAHPSSKFPAGVFADQVKISACVYLEKYMKNLVTRGDVSRKQFKSAIFQSILNGIICKQIPHRYRLQLGRALGYLIRNQYTSNVGIIPRILILLDEYFKSNDLNLVAHLVLSVFQGTKQLSILLTLYKKCFLSFLSSLTNETQEFRLLFSVPLPTPLPQIISTRFQNLVFALEVLAKMIVTYDFDKYRSTSTEMLKNTHLFELCLSVLQMEPAPSTGKLFVEVDPTNPNSYFDVGQLRTSSCKILFFLIDGAKPGRYNLQELPHVLQCESLLLGWIAKCLPSQIASADPNSQLLFLYIDILRSITKIPYFHNEVSLKRSQIITEIILPHLGLAAINSNYDLNDQDSFQKYIGFLQDLCEKQQTRELRSAVAKLLEAMCDKVDGILTFVTQIAFILIESGLNLKEPKPFDLAHKQLVESCDYFKMANQIRRAESGFIIMGLLSYLIDKREDITLLIEKYVEVWAEQVYQLKNRFLMVIFCEFYSFYADILFMTRYPEKKLKFVVFFINLSKSSSSSLAEIYQAYSCLNSLLTEERSIIHFENNIPEIMTTLAENLNGPLQTVLFPLLETLFISYGKNISMDKECMEVWLKTLTQKLSEESRKTEKTIILDKIFNLLETMLEHQEYFPYNYDIISCVQVCLHLLEGSAAHQDSIINLLNAYIKSSKSVPAALMMHIIKVSPKIISSNSDSLGRLFVTFDLAVIYTEDIPVLDRISMIIMEHATTIRSETISNDLLQGVLLLHLIIFYHARILPRESVVSIVKRIVDIVEQQQIVLQPELYSKYLLALLMLLNHDFELTCQAMGPFKEKYLSAIYLNANTYEHDNYDSKNFVITQIALLQKYGATVLSPQMVEHSFSIVIELIKKLYQNTTGSRPKAKKSDDHSQDSFEPSDYDSEADDITENYKATMHAYITPFKQIDEFNRLNKFIQKFKHNEYSQWLEDLINNLDVPLHDFLMRVAVNLVKVSNNTRQILKIKRH